MKQNLMEQFGTLIQKMIENSNPHENLITTPENIWQEAIPTNRCYFEQIMDALLLPGSRIEGVEGLQTLNQLNKQGKSCLILSSHFTNFDVPALYTLMKKQGPIYQDIFDRIVFVAGKKLTETSPHTKAFTEMFSRIVIVPKEPHMTQEQEQQSFMLNRSAQKKINQEKTNQRIFLVYPTGTRVRPWDKKTFAGIPETYNYIRNFDYFICCGISGCILPPSKNPALIYDYPAKDEVIYRFNTPLKSDEFLKQIEANYSEVPRKEKKQKVVDEIMELLYSLGDDPRVKYAHYEYSEDENVNDTM